jgi:hypothetical protein
VSKDFDFTALLREAEARVGDEGLPEHFGEELLLAEGESYSGRYRGEDYDARYDPPRLVYLLADLDWTPHFIRARAMLERQMREAEPAHGDYVVLVRARRRPSLEHALHRRALEELARISDTPEERPSGRPRVKYPEALELVREMLADGPRPSSELKAEGRRRGMSERTVERAARELGVVSEVTGDRSGKGGRIAFWHPPAFWRDRSQERSEIGSDKTVATAPYLSLSVGSPYPLVTPLREARGVLSRPTSETPSEAGAAGNFVATDSGLGDCQHETLWKARDGIFRCLTCEPPRWPGEVVETRQS